MICSGKDFFVMADSKLVNEHRAWLKDAEKGKTRACIIAILVFLSNSASAIVNANSNHIQLTVFLVIVIMAFALVAALLIFNGRSAGRGFLIVDTALLAITTLLPLISNEAPINTIAFFCGCELILPLACLVFTFANFYMRRYFTFMVLYRQKKIYL